MDIQHKIYEIFPGVNWISLNKTKYNRIRFYFDDIESGILNLSNEILKYIFNNNEVYCCFMLFNNKNSLNERILESLNKRNLNQIIETNEVNSFKINNNYCLQFFSEVSINDIKNINKAIVEEDFWIEPELSLRCYYFNFNKKVCIHLYNDRWMDIIGCMKELKKIQEKFLNKIQINFE